ncbi:MAG TPA: M20 family metallopeptidase [Terriglobia bacterium]|nr:M20 family metallopeptidase [Terriglobia bacterium]
MIDARILVIVQPPSVHDHVWKGNKLDFQKLIAYCRADLPAVMECLRQAVEIESPSDSKTGIDRLTRFFAHECKRRHGKVTFLEQRDCGAGLIAEFWGKTKGAHAARRASRIKPVLLLGHLDTVWPRGTLARMPFRIRNGRAYGPGILDMKAGIVIGLAAIRCLHTLGIEPASSVRLLLTSDEEVGSRAFRKKIEAEARRARAVLVLEPAAEGGAMKTSRKGVGEFEIRVHGRASHAGINPERGVNAIAELARQLLRLDKFADPQRGITLNAGVIEGGTRPNVVPELARAVVDVRIRRLGDGERIERKMFGLKPIHPQARLEVKGGINRPPLERIRAIELYRKARALGRGLGFEVEEASTGGGSDGNFSAALGIPTLDGLGAVGDGAHAIHEHIVIRELPRRAALLAALVATL